MGMALKSKKQNKKKTKNKQQKMGRSGNYHTKLSKPDKDKYHVILLICGIIKKYANELTHKIETDPET